MGNLCGVPKEHDESKYKPAETAEVDEQNTSYSFIDQQLEYSSVEPFQLQKKNKNKRQQNKLSPRPTIIQNDKLKKAYEKGTPIMSHRSSSIIMAKSQQCSDVSEQQQQLQITDDLMERAHVIMDYYKFELLQLLPEVRQQIQRAASVQDPVKSKKKFDKVQKALRNVIDDSRKQILQAHAELLEGTPISKTKKFNSYIELVKKEKPDSNLAKSAREIEDAIAFCFDPKSPIPQDQSDDEAHQLDDEEINKLNINVDDLNIGLEEYKKVLNKVFAGLRYEMYQRVKQLWAEIGDQVMEEKQKKNPSRKPPQDEGLALSFYGELDEEDVLIDREQILQIAENVDKNMIYRRALSLLGYDAKQIYCGDLQLLMRKLDYIFMCKQPVNQDFLIYISVLTKAQDQMLELIYHPLNKFIKMEENPLDSIDMAYGIPLEFNQIFDSVNDYVNQEKDEDDDFEYVDMGETDPRAAAEGQQERAVVIECSQSEENEPEQDALSPDREAYDDVEVDMQEEFEGMLNARKFDQAGHVKLQRVRTYTMCDKVKTRLRKSIVRDPDMSEGSEDEDEVNDLEKAPKRAPFQRVRRQTLTNVDLRTNQILSPFTQPFKTQMTGISKLTKSSPPVI